MSLKQIEFINIYLSLQNILYIISKKAKELGKVFMAIEKNIKEITLQLRLTLFDWITLHGFADRVTILCGFAARK